MRLYAVELRRARADDWGFRRKIKYRAPGGVKGRLSPARYFRPAEGAIPADPPCGPPNCNLADVCGAGSRSRELAGDARSGTWSQPGTHRSQPRPRRVCPALRGFPAHAWNHSRRSRGHKIVTCAEPPTGISAGGSGAIPFASWLRFASICRRRRSAMARTDRGGTIP